MVDSEECRSLLCSLLLLGRDILPWSMSLMCCTIRLMATSGENFHKIITIVFQILGFCMANFNCGCARDHTLKYHFVCVCNVLTIILCPSRDDDISILFGLEKNNKALNSNSCKHIASYVLLLIGVSTHFVGRLPTSLSRMYTHTL